GPAGVMVKVAAPDVLPPGPGLNTVTEAWPAEAMSEAGIAATSRVALTNVVVRSEPFQRTCELEATFEPVTVRLKPAPPAVADVGLRREMAGAGAGAVMVKVAAPEVPPPEPGLNTVTAACPVEATSAAGIAATRRVALTNVVVRSEPFQRTC